MGECVVIVMPLREAPALSQLTGQPPFEVTDAARPLIVVTQSDCKQIEAISGWHPQRLAAALAQAWVDILEKHPPRVSQLVRAQRLLRKVDSASAVRAKDVDDSGPAGELAKHGKRKSRVRELAEDEASRHRPAMRRLEK